MLLRAVDNIIMKNILLNEESEIREIRKKPGTK